MKAYQDHDLVADKGKAAPRPKRPAHHSSKRLPVIAFKNHSGPLYKKLPRHRAVRTGIYGHLTPSYIRVDCCTNGHA